MADDTEKRATEILAPEREPDRAEQAALDCVRKQAWVLWHADDYPASVIRLLARAGLLRDPAREAELKEADHTMRRLEDEANVKLKRAYSAALEEIDRLREALNAHQSPAAVSAGSSLGAGASRGTPEAQEAAE